MAKYPSKENGAPFAGLARPVDEVRFGVRIGNAHREQIQSAFLLTPDVSLRHSE
jgi:hypothetical protein